MPNPDPVPNTNGHAFRLNNTNDKTAPVISKNDLSQNFRKFFLLRQSSIFDSSRTLFSMTYLLLSHLTSLCLHQLRICPIFGLKYLRNWLWSTLQPFLILRDSWNGVHSLFSFVVCYSADRGKTDCLRPRASAAQFFKNITYPRVWIVNTDFRIFGYLEYEWSKWLLSTELIWR